MSDSRPPLTFTLINIEGLPRISELLSDLFRQLQLAGLFVGHFGTVPKQSDKDFLKRFGLRPGLLDSIISAIENYLPDKIVPVSVPVISNRARWSDPKQLGGVLPVKSSELLASYVGCWQHAAQYPESAAFRFVRLAFWHWRESDDFFSALLLLLNLNKAGFFLNVEDFERAAHSLCNTYTRNFDVTSLKDHDFDTESGDAALVDMIRVVPGQSHDEERVREIFDWVADHAFDEADRARQASSADEWAVAHAVLRGVLELLIFLERRHRDLLGATQRAIASQFEEVLADLVGYTLVTHLVAREGRPLLLKLHGIQGVGLEYQHVYGADWLDKLMEDRILAPDVLRESVQAAYQGAELPGVREIEIPIEWQMVSSSIAWSLCAAFNRDPLFESSLGFSTEEVNAACLEMGYSPDPKAVLSQFSVTELAAARRKLSGQALATLLGDPSLFNDDGPGAIKKLNHIGRLYPWNQIVRRELGIRHDQAGDVTEAYRQLRAAVLLDPTEAMNWQSLSVVLNRLGEQQDAGFALAICEMIKQREGEPDE